MNSSSNSDRLCSNLGSRDFTDENEADRSDREIVNAVPDNHDCGLGPDHARAVLVVRYTIKDSDEKHHDGESGKTTAVDTTTADLVDEEPGCDGAAETDGEITDTHIEGFATWKTSDCDLLARPCFLERWSEYIR